jgi:aquaporin TIP
MKNKLVTVQAVMVDAENRSHGSESVRLWLKKLKSAAYNIDDTIDELEANTVIWRSTTCPVEFYILFPEYIKQAYCFISENC